MLTSGVGAMTTPQITTGQPIMAPKGNSITQPNAGFGSTGHEFSSAPYSLAGKGTGIGGTTRQFGGPRW